MRKQKNTAVTVEHGWGLNWDHLGTSLASYHNSWLEIQPRQTYSCLKAKFFVTPWCCKEVSQLDQSILSAIT